MNEVIREGGAGFFDEAWQRWIVVALAVLVGASRLVALSKTLWDWDELLFCLGLRDYDVAAHHPHPPGFPLFIALARIARLFVSSDFHALQSVNVVAALLAFPVCYLLARAMRFDFPTSITAALVFSFLPNVWFYGGTGLSDVPAMVLAMAAAAALLRGSESRRSYLLGCVLLGASIIFRPQNVLMGLWPWFAASWPRFRERRLDPIVGAVVVTLIVFAGYGGAAWATGFDRYVDAVTSHSKYVGSIDSFRNPGRPTGLPLVHMWIDPPGAGKVGLFIAGLALLATLRMRRPTRHVLLTFGPFFLFALFMLSAEAPSRLSLGYMPGFALLAAEAISLIAGSLRRWPRARVTAHVGIAALIIGRMVYWTLPALNEVRRHASPPAQALSWIEEHLHPDATRLYVHGSMGPWNDYLLGSYQVFPVDDDMILRPSPAERPAWLLHEWPSNAVDARNFSRPHNQLWGIARKRYFDVALVPVASVAHFGDGWYEEEGEGSHVWRWMGKSSTLELVPLPGGKGELMLRFYVPLDGLPTPPTITVTLNGQQVDRFVATAPDQEKQWIVDASSTAPNVVKIEVSPVVNPAASGIGGDPRDLGLQLRAFGWRAAG